MIKHSDASAKTSHRESYENYDAVVYRNGKYRVIVCKDNIQWILQMRIGRPESVRGVEWKGISYYCDHDALNRSARAFFGAETPKELAGLPSFFKRGARNG